MFDFNKLDKYKKFMLGEGVTLIYFRKEDIELTIVDDDKNRDFILELSRKKKEIVEHNWKEFKKKVANYFLEEER